MYFYKAVRASTAPGEVKILLERSRKSSPRTATIPKVVGTGKAATDLVAPLYVVAFVMIVLAALPSLGEIIRPIVFQLFSWSS